MSGTDAVREDRFSSRVPPRGSVLRWRHQGMTHVAVHTGPVHGFEPDRTWRIAGREAPSQWEHVRSLVGNNPCSLATDWVDVPYMSPVDFGDADAASYAESIAIDAAKQPGTIRRPPTFSQGRPG